MRVLIGIGHPGHVHFYKHVIRILEENGHQVVVASRDKDVTLYLLETFGIRHVHASSARTGVWGMACEYIQRELALATLIRKFKPDIVTEIGGLFLAPLGRLFRIPSVIFTDSEPVKADQYLTYPHATWICTPNSFFKDLGPKHVRYAGYHELAYLHPKRFTPNPEVRTRLGVGENERFAIVRFVSWNASHDIGQKGFGDDLKKDIVEELTKLVRVFITSESGLGPEFRKYEIDIPPEEMHDALYYSTLFLGDGATMATEAAVLGTPAVRSSSLALTMSNFVELMDKYKLVYSYESTDDALRKCKWILARPDAKKCWQQRASNMLKDKIDVATWAARFIENPWS